MTGSIDAAVVGAGPAGLAAAWSLARDGARVTVYETRAEPGGRMRTDAVDGFRVDPAVQLLGSYYTETLRLADEIGARRLLSPSPGRDALWRRGRARSLDYGSVTSMAASGALPARLKLRLATRYLPFLRRHADALDAADPTRAAAAGLDDESIAAWARREQDADFIELMAYPLLGAYYGATPEQTSAGFYHALARAGIDVRLYGVVGGVGELARAAARALESRGARLRVGVQVRSVESTRTGVHIRSADGESRHDAAVLAVPPPVVGRIADPPEPLRRWLGGVRMAPSASLALLLERPVSADYFGLSFPRTSRPGNRVVACCIEERKGADGLVPEGRGLLVAYPAPARSAEAAVAEPRALLDLLLPAVRLAFPEIEGTVRRAKAYRFPCGHTLFHPGYLRHLGTFDPSWLSARLALAGDYLVAPTVEGAVRSGRRAARRLLDRAPFGG